ncbi:growth arrest and DNA damage-inducible proteins-interacting protein 1-like [Branchiostoma floridae]|uniref:Large ribosomal subunit protein mL64 n=2 Tax=Branchiostoma floridae TaxID=7739 RepID=A0A9J7NCR2_BRAFL|nr:growth arrest and DNA damage-inducible proteins-interacting protein 1-like [Branchiostoma floridae]
MATSMAREFPRLAFLCNFRVVSPCLGSSTTSIFSRTQNDTCMQVARYRAPPFPLDRSRYIPDKSDPKTPEFQKTLKFDRKLWGRHGEASGFDPSICWPTKAELAEMQEEERDWCLTLQEMQQNIAIRRAEEEKARIAREKRIAANMAKMPKLIEQVHEERRLKKEQLEEAKKRKEHLIAKARERLGYNVHPNSPKFEAMLEEIENEERKQKKKAKKAKQEAMREAFKAALATAEAAKIQDGATINTDIPLKAHKTQND